MRVFPGSRREALVGLVVALAQAALGATKNGQAAEPGYVTAVNLSPEARQRAHLSDADREEMRGYEREQREWARDEFRRELNLAGDGPGESAYGWGTRRWWSPAPAPDPSSFTSKLAATRRERPPSGADGARGSPAADRGVGAARPVKDVQPSRRVEASPGPASVVRRGYRAASSHRRVSAR